MVKYTTFNCCDIGSSPIRGMFVAKPKRYAIQIYIKVEKEYIKKVREIGEEISLEKERDEIKKLYEPIILDIMGASWRR